MNLKEVSRATGVNKKTIRRLLEKGVIAAGKDALNHRVFDPDVVPFLRRFYKHGDGPKSVLQELLMDDTDARRMGRALRIFKSEPLGTCGHRFTEHARGVPPLAHTHGCMKCPCPAWCGFANCIWCDAPLIVAENQCVMMNIEIALPASSTKMPVIVSRCSAYPEELPVVLTHGDVIVEARETYIGVTTAKLKRFLDTQDALRASARKRTAIHFFIESMRKTESEGDTEGAESEKRER